MNTVAKRLLSAILGVIAFGLMLFLPAGLGIPRGVRVVHLDPDGVPDTHQPGRCSGFSSPSPSSRSRPRSWSAALIIASDGHWYPPACRWSAACWSRSGSAWRCLLLIPGMLVFVLRIRDEEDLLEQELSGYRDYEQQVHYRLVPHVW
jgi:hypothetical protein